MNPLKEASKLVALSIGYFVSYLATGVMVKWFTDPSREGHLSQLDFLIQNTAGSSLMVLSTVVLIGWFGVAKEHLFSQRAWPVWVSGLCTAVIIPSTTFMYLLPISVMVAMVIMRGSVIVISRMVDLILIRKGVLKRQVTWEEELAVIFALLAVGTQLFGIRDGSFAFIRNSTALTILGLYLAAYSIRIYIMNIYKNDGVALRLENRSFFTIEQFGSVIAMLLGASIFVITSTAEMRTRLSGPQLLPMLSGLPYAGVAFFSVFIFMFRGRTATFAGVLNRLISLSAGTVSTLILAWLFGFPSPSTKDWVSFFWVVVATGLLAASELRGLEQRKKETGYEKEVSKRSSDTLGYRSV